MSDADLSRRVEKLENVVEPLPRLETKIHNHANILQTQSAQLNDILGPKGSMLMRLTKVEGALELFDERLKRIDDGVDGLRGSVSKLVDASEAQRSESELQRADIRKLTEASEIQKVDVAGRWQMRATMFTAAMSALGTAAIAAMQFVAS